MGIPRIFGIIAFVIGIIILAFGLNSTQSVTEKVVEGVSGRFTENTMWYIIIGIALIIGGAAFAISSYSKRQE